MSVITGNLAALGANLAFQTDVTTLPSISTVAVQTSGNWTGTLSFQATIDNVNWFAVTAIPLAVTPVSPTSTTTVNGQFSIPIQGYAQVRAIFSSYSAGAAVVSMDGTNSTIVLTNQIVTIASQTSNAGGPALASGIPSLVSSDLEKSYQGKENSQMVLVPTVAGNSFVTFIDNPWVLGLTVGSAVFLSPSQNGQAAEEVYIGTNNIPTSTPGGTTINLVNPVVNSGSNYATFDQFEPDGPSQPSGSPTGATVIGVKGQIQYLLDPNPVDPKRPIFAATQARGNPGLTGVVSVPDALGSSDESLTRQLLEAILLELRTLNFMVAQLKDGGTMEVPLTLTSYNNGTLGQ